MAEEGGKMSLAFGATLALVHIAALGAIRSGLAFLGGLSAWVLGAVLFLIGAGVAMKSNKSGLGGWGLTFIGVGFALQGLSEAGLAAMGGLAVSTSVVGLALLLVQYARMNGLVKF